MESIDDKIEKEISLYFLDQKYNENYIDIINKKYNGKLLIDTVGFNIPSMFLVDNKIIFNKIKHKYCFEVIRRCLKYKHPEITIQCIFNLKENSLDMCVKGNLNSLNIDFIESFSSKV